MRPRSVAFIQARMSSKRLPGKVLAPIAGYPMLAWVVRRTRVAASVDETWVLTSEDESDDPIEAFCGTLDVPCFRGSLDDVLDRYIQAKRVVDPEIIIRVTADCPLVDPAVIDSVVQVLENHPKVVYAATRMPEGRTFPLGIDIEAFRSAALEAAADAAQKPYQREHVTPWFYDGSQQEPIVRVDAERDLSAHRWTVDTAEDLAFIRALWPKLPSEEVGYEEITEILESEPDLQRINAHVKQKNYLETDG